MEEALEEIDAIASAPMAMTAGEQDDELLDLLDQLENARVAMEDMRTAWQAKREGWLDQLPQTGKENSWRYQNGERLESDVPEALMDLPDGVSTFSVKGYWGIDVSHHQGVIDWEAVKAEMDHIYSHYLALIAAGVAPDSPQAQAVAAQHHAHIEARYYDAPPAMMRGLAQMWVQDDRFTRNIDRAGPGLAAYQSAAVTAWADAQEAG